tara:strand:- start:900 stop:1292 length:393 start_codon:yes stop_codon:yes gene_type:complete
MNKLEILSAFNVHFLDFLQDIERVFPNDVDIKTAINFLQTVKKTNPRLIIIFFKQHINDLYGEYIHKNDLTYFLNKKYDNDIIGDSTKDILNKIDQLREPIRKMDSKNKQHILQYMQDLCKLSVLYNSLQ